MTDKLNVMGVTHCSSVDGPGLRTVVWFQGCKNKCPGCHNPDSWDVDKKEMLYTAEQLYELAAPNKLEDGLTLSGGDPLWQNNLLALAYFIRMYHYFYPQKNIWMYTGLKYGNIKKHIREWVAHVDTGDPINVWNISEYTRWLYDFLFEYVDVLVDGPFMEELKTNDCIYRGSSNQRLIDMKESMKRKKIVR